jgi:hypothetical protein
MRLWSAILYFSTALMVGKAETAFPVTYAGGSLPLRHDKVTAKFNGGAITFTQHGHRISVPVENITAISCGSEVRRRFGAAVLGVVPWMQLDKAEKDYVGVTWNEDARKMEVLFKLSSREYRDFLSALEASTGKKAVNAHKVPMVVDYGTTL